MEKSERPEESVKTDGMQAEEENMNQFTDERELPSVRRRIFSAIGKQHEFDKISDTFKGLQTLATAIVDLIDKETSYETIKAKHTVWMGKYESYLERNNYIMSKLAAEDQEQYVDTFEERENLLSEFKHIIKEYFKAKMQEAQQRENDRRSQRSTSQQSSSHRTHSQKSGSSRSHNDSGSHHSSNILYKKMKEEQRVAELEAKIRSFESKQELELAKMKLKLQEERLQLKTELEMSDARSKVLQRYDNLGDEFEENISIRSKMLVTTKQTTANKPSLNVEAKLFEPKTSGSDTEQSIVNKDAAHAANESMIKHLRKPVSDIKKFGGDPLEFRKFMRQFQSRVIANAENEEEKLTYLEQFTIGEANRVVSGYSQLSGTQAFELAMKVLADRYGDEEVIANAFIKKALTWQNIQPGDAKALDEFSLFLIECKNAIESIDAVGILEYSENIKCLMKKLPLYFHDRWRNIIQVKRDKRETIRFEDFVNFVSKESKKLNDPVYGNTAIATANSQRSKFVRQAKDQKPKQAVNPRNSFATDLSNEHSKIIVCSFCGKHHMLENCKEILKLSIPERYEHMKRKGRCFGCLKVGHMTVNCKNRSVCNTCKGRHPTLLHKDERSKDNKLQESTKTDNNPPPKPSASTTHPVETVSQTGAGDCSCAMAIIPVKVKLRDRPAILDTYAFFDSGSSISFCTDDLLHRLGGSGKRMNIKLNTMGESFSMLTQAVTGLQVMDFDMQNIVEMPRTYTKQEMPVSKEQIPKQAEILKWSHLSGIPWNNPDVGIGLMIGNNVADAYTPFEIATGPCGSPHATRTRLGWIIWNVIRDINETDGVVNRTQLISISSIDNDHDRLEKLVKNSMNYDFPERRVDDRQENSVEDKKFLELVKESICYEDGHYTIGLPFRNENVQLPNNKTQAMQRLKSLKNKFDRNPKFKQDYVEFMNKLIDKGYMELVTSDDMNRNDGRVWYLPHHGVYHAQKNKIRVVFDCSATYLGTSLNSQLLQGPNLTNNLLGVLLRFREENIAILGDIESMFHQVRVPPKDRDCLRFCWWPNGDVNNEPIDYRMTAHIFGATSSPSCCNYALKETAKDFVYKYEPSVSAAVMKGMYVDDCLASVDSENSAVSAIKDITSLCKDGGFRMTKWISNIPSVIESIPETERAKGIQQWTLKDELPVERALGVQWSIESDCFGFHVEYKDKPATRRTILSITSSVYDPMGIISPFILNAKSILQKLCKQGYGWDQELTGVELKQWKEWLNQLDDLENIQLPRCYKPIDFGQVRSCQLHCFSDASETGYGMVFYLRMTDDMDRVHCAFVLGKSRVAPLKKITIPRLELTAAAKAVKLSQLIIQELTYEIHKIVFWTDSMSVIRYINNQKSRFHTFVANRLELIQEATSPEQWRYINTKLNPADHASRGMKISTFETKSEWLHGPSFLLETETSWPEYDYDKSVTVEDAEVKEVVNSAVSLPKQNFVEKLMTHFSDWNKLKRIVARLLMFFDFLRSIIRKDSMEQDQSFVRLTASQLRRSETSIIRQVQRDHFEQEITFLQSGHGKIRENLRKLDPFLDENGILRVGGRLERADLPYDAKHPILLPKDSHISRMIITDIHRSVGHLGKNTILTELRKKFWIIGAGVIVKGVVSKCVTCRKYQGPLLEQKMSNLPNERLVPDKPAFSMVGIDFFGPFCLKQRRCTVKRYGMIFTCLSIRAIHLEITHTMDTDSCINALRRFIARRGTPEFIRSDNGTNLIGAERELRDEIQRWNLDKLNSFMAQTGIRWEFNPPSASHFGGVWERLIRSVRKVLYSVIKEQNVRLDDESLATFFCEVESILNNRPITDISENVHDIKALTPNHLLLLRSGESFPPGIFYKTDNYVRRRWRQIQYLADLFWKRWTSEYIPLLQQRQKWIAERRNVRINDIVLIQDNCPRNYWNLGRVVEVMKDDKGIVRSVKVKTAASVLTRPIAKLCLLLEADTDCD